MTQSQPVSKSMLNLQTRIADLEQDNQQMQSELTQLRHSEARYRQMFENASISILFIGSDGLMTEANAAFEQLYGMTIEDYNAKTGGIFHDAQLIENGTLHYMQRALAGEMSVEPPTYYDASCTVAGANFLHRRGHYFPIRNTAGEVTEIVEIAPDYAEFFAVQQQMFQQREQSVQERGSLLDTIAQVANLLLRSSDYNAVLPDVVQLLGEAVGSDRSCITQDVVYPASGQLAVKLLVEWTKLGIGTTTDFSSEYDAGFIVEEISLELHQLLLRGEVVNFCVADLSEPMRSVFAAQGNTSMLIVPIMVRGQCWGEIGFVNCEAPRLFDEAEIAILKIAADSLAAAIERQVKDDELRRSEALYRSLFEISNEGIYRWELDQPISIKLPVDEQVDRVYRYHSFAQANDALAAMYGFEKGEDVAGMRLATVHPHNSEKTLEMMRAICGNGWQVRNAESEEIDINGQKRYFLNSIISTIENDFVSTGWGTQIDITELRQAQQALLAAEQDRAELLKTVTNVANQLLRSTDYTTVLPSVLHILGEAAIADRCSLIQNIADSHTGKPAARMHTEWCHDGIQTSISHTPDLESALLWEVFSDGYTKLSGGETLCVMVNDLAEPARSLLLTQGNASMLMVPIVVQGQFWGVFGFDYCQEIKYPDDVNTAIFAIAVDSIAAAIERQQQEEALLQSEREKQAAILYEQENAAQLQVAELAKANEVLKKTLDTLATEPKFDCFLKQVLSVVTQQMNAPDCLLWLFDDALQTATMQSIYTNKQANLSTQHPAAVSTRTIRMHQSNWVFRTDQQQPYLLEVETSPFSTSSRAYLTRLGIKAILIIPLLLGDRLIGSLAVRLFEVRSFKSIELELVQALAHQTTLALQLNRLAEQASHSAVLEERNRMAREIHDILAQAFTGIVVHLEAARMITPDDSTLQPLIAQAQDLARSGLVEARRSVWSLRPQALENDDLPRALKLLVQDSTDQTPVQIQLQVQGIECAIALEVETHLLRIAQEALTNALKHAHASTVKIELRFEIQQIELEVRDDGQGFDPTAQRFGEGFGLVSMQERANCINGAFTLTSQLGLGTNVLVILPREESNNLTRRA